MDDPSTKQIEATLEVIRKRLSGLGLEGTATMTDDGQIAIEIQEVSDAERVKSLISKTMQLVFKDAEEDAHYERECLVSLEELRLNSLACAPVDRGGEGRFVDKDIGLTGEDLSRAFPGRDPTTNAPVVHIQFNERGTATFRDLTRRIAGDQLRRIAIFLDGEEVTAPVVRSPVLDGRAVIEGGFTNELARTLAIQLDSGHLPVPLELILEEWR